MSLNSIPSQADFARAHDRRRNRDRGLSEVRSKILDRFQNDNLHEAFVFYSAPSDLFVVYLFYQRDDQITKAEELGITSQIKGTVLEELEKVGRGNRDTLKVDFQIDSHENVEANFEGDYYLRLR